MRGHRQTVSKNAQVASGPALYREIGPGYTATRQTEPRIARVIWEALGDARTVLNVGAGSGSYEPQDRVVVALEPAPSMYAQRTSNRSYAVAGVAEALPFRSGCFDAAMEIVSDQHWSDPLAGLNEMRRVARRVVAFQWHYPSDQAFWLVRDYLPEFLRLGNFEDRFVARAEALGAELRPVPIPWDCVDGFFHAFWRRPEAYLDERIRRGTSVWARVGKEAEQRVVAALRRDLESGAWHERNRDILDLEELDLGAKVVTLG